MTVQDSKLESLKRLPVELLKAILSLFFFLTLCLTALSTAAAVQAAVLWLSARLVTLELWSFKELWLLCVGTNVIIMPPLGLLAWLLRKEVARG